MWIYLCRVAEAESEVKPTGNAPTGPSLLQGMADDVKNCLECYVIEHTLWRRRTVYIQLQKTTKIRIPWSCFATKLGCIWRLG